MHGPNLAPALGLRAGTARLRYYRRPEPTKRCLMWRLLASWSKLYPSRAYCHLQLVSPCESRCLDRDDHERRSEGPPIACLGVDRFEDDRMEWRRKRLFQHRRHV
jgi:hypothetical protein